MQIIGLAGKKQVGKTTAASTMFQYFKSQGKSSAVIAFADPIRRIGCVFGWTWQQMLEDKNAIHPVWEISWRQFAQQVGTDALRNNFRSDIWLKVMEMSIEIMTPDYLIITDVRFDNEHDFIKEKNGLVVNIIRDTGLQDSHQSEVGLSTWDITMMNMGTLELFEKRCKDLAKSIDNGLLKGKGV